MRRGPTDDVTAAAMHMQHAASPANRRHRQGRTASHAGRAAEDAVSRLYQRSGARLLATRHRTPEGEIDLVVEKDRVLIFVEVKHRKNFHSLESPITNRQWQRLECAALHYMMQLQKETGVQPVCRFDVAFVDRCGRIEIIENARSF